MKSRPMAKVEEIRRKIGHPIVDADAHQLETVPVLLDYLREIGGSAMPARLPSGRASSRLTTRRSMALSMTGL